ncbi:hypothetical protein [Propionibacterium australiense]|uniref:Uncharacterized protein n=1 Tax=Propionibacterium australiense TaxID=119981 RepID=A0A383S5A7_9ACTN|nr:hypothetical protein [Propionibacterium australiense]SYZ32456.1 Hypothetical protein PROPAUS_0335 [Propionibacterium australiense]VEH90175.1 Uncharacterised protein [Propionibacterium australiense]
MLDIPAPTMRALVGVLDVLTVSSREALLIADAELSGADLHRAVRRRLRFRDTTMPVGPGR